MVKKRKGKITSARLRPQVKVKGKLWEFHKGDNDSFPSVPHGHSQDGKFKLQLWNGYIFDASTGKHIYTAKKKDMEALKKAHGFLEFVSECREEYKQRNPLIVLPELDINYSCRKASRVCLKPCECYEFYIQYY